MIACAAHKSQLNAADFVTKKIFACFNAMDNNLLP